MPLAPVLNHGVARSFLSRENAGLFERHTAAETGLGSIPIFCMTFHSFGRLLHLFVYFLFNIITSIYILGYKYSCVNESLLVYNDYRVWYV